MLRAFCLSSFCRLSVTTIHPGKTAGWIEMPLGTEVGPGQTSIVLDRDPSPPTGRGQKGRGDLTLILEYLENGERYDVRLK